METRFPLVLVLAALLGGCVGAPEPSPDAPPEAPVVVTSPTDYAYLDAARPSERAHLHDYWNGSERYLVMDEVRFSSAFFVEQSWSFAFRPPEGRVVPQGASAVEVVLDWQDPPGASYERPQLWVRTAADAEPKFVADVVRGETLVVPTDNARNDLPHSALSAWELQLRVHPGSAGGGLIVFRSDVTLVATALRGLEIPLYPGHPDRWNGSDELALLDEDVPEFVFVGPAEAPACFEGCPQRHRPASGRVVPHDAASVEVVLETPAGSATQLGLKFHGADTRELQPLAPASREGGRATYVVPVGRGMGDGPYAAQSSWEFLVFAEGPVEDGAHSGAYRIVARALRAP